MGGKKKNPWAAGEDAEKRADNETSKTDSDLMRSVDEHIKQLSEEARVAFRERVEQAGGTFAEEFETDGVGCLKLDLENSEGTIWDCVEPTGDFGRLEKGLDPAYTPEDIMRSAMLLQRKFPDMDFAFKDERPKRFSYTLKLRHQG